MSTNLKLFRIEGHEYVAETPDSAYATHMDGWRALVTLDGGFKPLVPVLVKDKATPEELGAALHNTLAEGALRWAPPVDEIPRLGRVLQTPGPGYVKGFHLDTEDQKEEKPTLSVVVICEDCGRKGNAIEGAPKDWTALKPMGYRCPDCENKRTQSAATLVDELNKLREEVRRKDAEAATLRDHVRKACAEFGFSLDFKTEVGVKYLRDRLMDYIGENK